MKILVCSDGHTAAGMALDFVARLAEACEGEVTLLGIIEKPEHEEALRGALQASAEIFGSRAVRVEVTIRSGAPLVQIERYTREHAFELVAIGAVRKAGEPFAMSEKAYHLVKQIAQPVLVVPGPATRFQRILLCTGGRECIEPAVELTARLACHGPLAVTMLHVLPDAPALYANLTKREIDPKRLLASRSALARNLRKERELLRAAGMEVEVKLRDGIVPDEILDEARTGGYDLVVTGSNLRQGPLRSYVMGDVTSAVLRESDRPVLVVKTGSRNQSFWKRLFGGKPAK